MKIALVTAWDASAPGLRQIFSIANARGCEVFLIHFRDLHLKFIPRRNYEEIKKAKEQNPFSGVECIEDGECFIPYRYPILDGEIELFREILRKQGPDIVGFKACWTNIETVELLTTHTRDVLPKAKIIWGGLVPTFRPERAIAFADTIFLGEADETFEDLLKDMNQKNIDGTWVREGNGGIRKNKLPCPPQNLDSLPPLIYGQNELLIDGGEVCQTGTVDEDWLKSKYIFSASRGCPFKCSFCIHGNRSELPEGVSYYRTKSVKRFVTELKDASSHHYFPHFAFWDDIFGCDERWLEEFGDVYKRELGIPFACNVHPAVSNKRFFQLLFAAGCRFVSMGLQSGREHIAQGIYKQRISLEMLKKAVENAKEAGIPMVQIDILTNSPFETEDDMKGTLKFLASLPRPTRNHPHQLIFYPGFAITQKLSEKKVSEPRLANEKIRHLYNALYLLAEEPEISQDTLLSMAENPSFRERPEMVDELLLSLHNKRARIQALEGDLRTPPLKKAIIGWGYRKVPQLRGFWNFWRKKVDQF